ncbi:MAG TPA: hypothetical protein ENK81_02830 [Euryarchaeota archaeon]|nr:hypothetical protein [Euryarchaeota archaeon]
MNIALKVTFLCILSSILLFVFCRLVIERTLGYIKGSSRKYMEEEDFMRISEVKYKHLYDVVIYRILSTITFTAFLSQILILNAPFNVWELFALGLAMFILSFIVDAILQSITFRRVVQGVYRGVEVLRVGTLAIMIYAFLSFVILLLVISSWTGFVISIFGANTPNVMLILLLSSITIFIVTSLTVSGHSRLILYIIACITTLALQISARNISISTSAPPEPFTTFFALIIALILMSMAYLNMRKSRAQELRSYFYEVFLVMFLFATSVGILAVGRSIANQHVEGLFTSGYVKATVIPALFYAFYPFTRMYSTIQKSIEDLQRVMDFKTYFSSTFIPSLAAYTVFTTLLIFLRIYNIPIAAVLVVMLVPLSIMFLFEYIIIFEALDTSMRAAFRRSKRNAQISSFIIFAASVFTITYLLIKWEPLDFNKIILSSVYPITAFSALYMGIFLVFAILSIKTEIKEA